MDHLQKEEVLEMIILFLKEEEIDLAEFTSLYQSLQAKSQHTTASTFDEFETNLRNGRWDLVLPEASGFDEAFILDLFEHIFRSLLFCHQEKSALHLLEHSSVLSFLCRNKFPVRYSALVSVSTRPSSCAFEHGEVSMVESRNQLADRFLLLTKDNIYAERGKGRRRLLDLLQQGLEVSSKRGRMDVDDADMKEPQSRFTMYSKFGKEVNVTCGAFSADAFAVGTSDGLVEFFDWDSLAPNKDPLFVDVSVACIAFSLAENYWAAVGDVQGGLHVFQHARTLSRRISQTGFTSLSQVCFSADGTRICALSNNCVIRVFSTTTGLKLCEVYEDHASAMIGVPNTNLLLLGTREGKLKYWDLATGQFVSQAVSSTEVDKVIKFQPLGKDEEMFVFTLKSVFKICMKQNKSVVFLVRDNIEDDGVGFCNHGENYVAVKKQSVIVDSKSVALLDKLGRFVSLETFQDRAIGVWTNGLVKLK